MTGIDNDELAVGGIVIKAGLMAIGHEVVDGSGGGT